MFLEVAEDNIPAQKLYLKGGFKVNGRRPRYYKREPAAIDAVLYRLDMYSLGA